MVKILFLLQFDMGGPQGAGSGFFRQLLCEHQELNKRNLLSISPALLIFVEKQTSIGCWFYWFLASITSPRMMSASSAYFLYSNNHKKYHSLMVI